MGIGEIKPLRGGYRIKKRLTRGQALLLDALWNKYGGVSEVARLLDVGTQTPVNWRRKAGVPPHELARVARVLGISVWALNYSFVKQLYIEMDNEFPKWVDVVNLSGLLPSTIEKVLKGQPPS